MDNRIGIKPSTILRNVNTIYNLFRFVSCLLSNIIGERTTPKTSINLNYYVTQFGYMMFIVHYMFKLTKSVHVESM